LDSDDEECAQIKPEVKNEPVLKRENFFKITKKEIDLQVKGPSSQEDYRKTCNLSERSTSSLVYEVEPALDCSAKANLGSIASIDEGTSPIPSDLDECEGGHFRTRDAQVFELDDWNQEELFDEQSQAKQALTESPAEKLEAPVPQKSQDHRQEFRLLYIPTTFTRKHIVAKLETFGALKSFEFVNLPDLNSKKSSNVKQQFSSNPKLASFKGYLSQQPQGKVEEFKGAIFTFVDHSAELKFSEIKRLRVKGLQIKVLIESTPKERPPKPSIQPRKPESDPPAEVCVPGPKPNLAHGASEPPSTSTPISTKPHAPLSSDPLIVSHTKQETASTGLNHEHRPTSSQYSSEQERQQTLAIHMSAAENYAYHRQKHSEEHSRQPQDALQYQNYQQLAQRMQDDLSDYWFVHI
jgi:hypothetical protein